MRASSWMASRLRAAPMVGLALSLVACGDLSSPAPFTSSMRDGDVAHLEGTAELSTQAGPGAPRVVRAQALWQVHGTVQRGAALADFAHRPLAMQDPTRGEDPDASRQRALGELGARLVPVVAVDARSRLAAYGRSSVVEDSMTDGHGGMLHFVAISDLAKGPLTDYLVVRDGKVLNYQKLSWTRDRGVWRPVEAKGYLFGADGSTLRVAARVAGLAHGPSADSATGLAALAARLEDIQFGALARRVILPAAAHAQMGREDIDCSQYRRTGVYGSGSSCLAFTMNKLDGLLVPAIAALAVYLKGLSIESFIVAARVGGHLQVAALVDALVAMGASLAAVDWAILAAVSVMFYASTQLASCSQFHQVAIAECQKTDTRPGGGSGSSDGSENDTGLVGDACSMACDPTRRGIIDDWRNGIRAAT